MQQSRKAVPARQNPYQPNNCEDAEAGRSQVKYTKALWQDECGVWGVGGRVSGARRKCAATGIVSNIHARLLAALSTLPSLWRTLACWHCVRSNLGGCCRCSVLFLGMLTFLQSLRHPSVTIPYLVALCNVTTRLPRYYVADGHEH